MLSNYKLGAILGIFTLLTLLYDVTVPLFEKPDELKHFAVIQHIHQTGQLPLVQPGVYHPWDQEGTQPPLYHLIAAGATFWLDLSNFTEPPRNPHYADDRSFVWRQIGNNNLYLHPPGQTWNLSNPVILAAHLARWLSLLWGLVTLWFTYRLGLLIFTATPPAWLPLSPTTLAVIATALVASLPQFLHTSSAITNDSLSTSLAAIGLWLLLSILRGGPTTQRLIGLGLVLGLGAITKLSLLYLAPLSGLVITMYCWPRRDWRTVLRAGAILVTLLLLISGWWFGRNWLVYGDVTALNAHLLYRGGPLDPTPSLAQIWQTELTGLELSFWAAFGAGQVLLEPALYSILRSVKYLVGVGLLLGIVRWLHLIFVSHRKASVSPEVGSGGDEARPKVSLFLGAGLLLLSGWSLLIFVALLRWMQITPASLGRLLFPTLPALGVLTVWGLLHLRPSGYPRLGLIGPGLLLGGLLTLALLGPIRYIPAAYQPTALLPATALAAQPSEPLNLLYADQMRLLGYDLATQTSQPGDWLPVTLYWQATRPLTATYSAFVHLIDPAGTAIAQNNSYPDQGNWPTHFLEPGQVLRDTVYVRIPLDAPAPVAARLSIGLFRFEDPQRAALPAVDGTGQPVIPLVGRVGLLPTQWSASEPDHTVEAEFDSRIRLRGFSGSNPALTVEAGATIPLTLTWQALQPVAQDLTLFLHLIDAESGEQVAGFDAPPAFPTIFWTTQTQLVDRRLLSLPESLSPGRYELRLGWYEPETFARLPRPDGSDSLTLLQVTVR